AQFQAYRARIAAAVAALSVHDVPDAARQLREAPEELQDWEWWHLHSRLDDSSGGEGRLGSARGRGDLGADVGEGVAGSGAERTDGRDAHDDDQSQHDGVFHSGRAVFIIDKESQRLVKLVHGLVPLVSAGFGLRGASASLEHGARGLALS